jgi:hypothetical protein
LTKADKHQALVLVSSDLAQGQNLIRKIVAEIRSICEVVGVSCVYKRKLQDSLSVYQTELMAVLRTDTSMDKDHFFETLCGIMAKNRGTKILLLSFDSTAQMLPELTLPHPQLARDSVVLRCASEVWGDFEHPILGQTLNQLVHLNNSNELVEFFSQGTSLF